MKFLKTLLWQRPWIPLGAVMLIGLVFGIGEARADDYRAHQGNQCPECAIYLGGTPRVWDGEIQVYAQDSSFEADIQRSIDTINLYADVPLVYMGTTSLPLIDQYDSARRGTVIVGYGDTGGFLGKGWIWWNHHSQAHINYGEITLSPSVGACKSGIMLHEMLHILGIGHSDDRFSIMYASPYHNCEYQQTLRLDDIEVSQSPYPARPNKAGVITSYDGGELCVYQPVITYEGITGRELTSCGVPTSIEVVID